MLSILYHHFLINLKSRLIYRWDFLLAIFIKGLEGFCGFIMLDFLMSKLTMLAGFSKANVLLMFGISELAFSIWHCFFINSLSIGNYLHDGSMDRFLLKPINPILQILMDGFDEDGWGALVFSIIVLFIAKQQGAPLASFQDWLFVLLFAANGSLIFFGLSLFLSSFSFLARTQTNLGLFVMDLRQFARVPISVFPKWFQVMISVLFPLALCGFWPTQFMIHYDFTILFFIFLISIVFTSFSIFFFYFMLKKHYESTGT